MEVDAKTLAILILIFLVVFKFIWLLLGGFDDLFDEFWEELDWKDNEIKDDKETDRDQSGEK